MRWAACIGASIAMAGCGRAPDAYYPLEEGATWTYRLRAGFVERVEQIRVVRKIAVGGVSGWEAAGPMGPSRLAWSSGRLIAESVPGTRFDPPIVLLDPTEPKAAWRWPANGKASVTTGGRKTEATAEATQRPEDLEVGGRTFKTLRSTLTLRIDGATLELDTWFAQGIGPLRQEQRAGGVLVTALERVSGP